MVLKLVGCSKYIAQIRRKKLLMEIYRSLRQIKLPFALLTRANFAEQPSIIRTMDGLEFTNWAKPSEIYKETLAWNWIRILPDLPNTTNVQDPTESIDQDIYFVFKVKNILKAIFLNYKPKCKQGYTRD